MTAMNETRNLIVPKEAAKTRSRHGAPGRRVGWLHFVLIPLSVLWLVPIIMVIGLSMMPPNNPGTQFFGIFPEEFSIKNYLTIWAQNPILLHLLNSLLITVPSVLLVCLLGSMTAFALARLRVPLKALIFGILILALILPMSSIVVATFRILQSMQLYNNLLGLVLVYTALGLPFAVIIIRTSYLAIPLETYEAARLDGASAWQIFWRIYLPLGKPALAVVAVWQTMMSWNDFLLPLVTLGDNALKPLTLVPLAYRGMYLSQPGALFAILVLISIPVVLLFLFIQKYLVNGLSGAIK
ncbi:carbohydrate ABC transporter permease [Microbacterium saperdae]|uniref:Carbohydrate ABC transporter membrane protein 2 (CUT1 family) n=1 Tax=Microbacterium saperdae TaxID=69368 RepID=A0A543B9R0_9MICO|nr:carbohydrate ABC transporter permease [Microbacterium saperdae]TQL81516.1 carbohydrate ABC transporter membrane protein 2 (CUT1 family) [Microbacterium saperdae]GGM59771.1 ABC transporter permease [Microbacterium saperdae]